MTAPVLARAWENDSAERRSVKQFVANSSWRQHDLRGTIGVQVYRSRDTATRWTMHTGIITFLFDSGEIAQESWHINVPSSEETLKRLREVARDRLPLLAANARIVQLKVTGQPIEKMSWKGTCGKFAWPRETLTYLDDGWTTRRHLRGIPREIFSSSGLTPAGVRAFQTFSRTLNRVGCVFVQEGREPRALSKIQPTHWGLLTAKSVKKATKKKLLALLGAEEGQRFWDSLKQQKAAAGESQQAVTKAVMP